ncbi:MAG: alpha/beta hydrolase [Steroidobacteraceae bacterium]|nr:alpha/beta hydrolase [Steroidobacteraceae bacterium]MDW8258020.1 alpha/beta hydrolase [Gammaproteobacteria bacterium]
MSATRVVFIHGLWMPGGESVGFRRALAAELGPQAQIDVFKWRTVTEPIAEVIDRLQSLVSDSRPERLHLVGHSLGGLVTLRFFEQRPKQPPGAVVLLGTPTCGSQAARAFGRLALGRRLLGAYAVEELLQEPRPRRWLLADRPLGVIAGTLPIGLGRLFVHFKEPNDGTVAVRETELEGAADCITMPVNHLGMLLSRQVVRQTAYFLTHGRFARKLTG